MRPIAIALLLAAAACSKATHKAEAAKPTEIAFDGAQATDAAAKVRHGERLTHVLGCTGCHGAQLQGEQFEPAQTQYGPIYGSNLTRALRGFSDSQVEAIVRQGAHPTRKTVWVMPSDIFQHLSAPDMAALLAYIRSLPPGGRPTPPPEFSAVDKRDIASGEYKPAVELVKEQRNQLPVDLGRELALGRYITEVTCAECHGPKLEGHSGPKGGTPDLIAAGGYTRAEFERLITQGVPTGGRKLREMMSGVAKYRFSQLTPHERDALYAYLKARAERPQ
jgi:mono/diheme cytochrome c family protein